jgi:hypothetical protein
LDYRETRSYLTDMKVRTKDTVIQYEGCEISITYALSSFMTKCTIT